jgi:hypothetical protein
LQDENFTLGDMIFIKCHIDVAGLNIEWLSEDGCDLCHICGILLLYLYCRSMYE